VYTQLRTSPLAALDGEKYLSLTTFRRDGTPVATPVWFVVDDGRVLVWTSAASWKAKRLRRDSRVRIAACDAGVRVERLLRRKYPVARRLLAWWASLARMVARRPRSMPAYVEITPKGG
jgi:predicted pyridoxine 5'-phosphate oxidase superfamily flavin-nucleotide-binding protein